MRTTAILSAAILATALAGCSKDKPSAAKTSNSVQPSATVSTNSAPKFGDLDALPDLTPAAVCALVPTAAVQKALTKQVIGIPDGTHTDGAGSNCIWKTGTDAAAAQAKIEFNTLTWQAAKGLGLLNSSSVAATVSGQEALTYSTVPEVTVCIVRLGGEQDAVLYVEAPAAEAAKSIAAAALTGLSKR